MNKNTLTGLLLMGIVIMVFMYVNKPSEADIRKAEKARQEQLAAEQKKADWILNGGIEKEWDSYLEKMEKYGLSDYLSIKQKYFDNYQKSLSE